MTARYLGTVHKARPTLQRWRDSPVTKAGIATRWIAWMANGWRPTTLALLLLLIYIGVTVPWLLLPAIAAAGWATVIDRRKPAALLIAVAGLVGSVWWTWAHADTPGRLFMILAIGVWPVDALAATHYHRYQLRRWWCEFRRGLPVRYAIMAAKSTRIQGAIDGEQQLIDGRRPILDHPAIARRPTFDGDTAWALCSVSPGRDAAAFQEVLQETSASFINVQRIDLVFTDDYQTYGYIVTRFGPPLLNPNAPAMPVNRLAEFVYRTAPHTAIALVVSAATWTLIA